MRRTLLIASLLPTLASAQPLLIASAIYGGSGWSSYGGNSQHTAVYVGASQSIKNIHWQASLDDNRGYYGNTVLIHYASPLVTALNTVVHAYRYTSSDSGTPSYDNWVVVGRQGSNGQETWNLPSDYSAPDVFPSGWTSVFPMCLVPVRSYVTLPFFPWFQTVLPITSSGVAAAGSGGTILVKTADLPSQGTTRIPFYTSLHDWSTNASNYSLIKINTPLTSDSSGNVYFGYMVTGITWSLPFPKLGTGGIAKVNVNTGETSFVTTSSLNIDPTIAYPALNAAPALSNDGQYLYVALSPQGGGPGYLAKLSTADLSKVASVRLMDPYITGAPVLFNEASSAAPMVGPDGHVFMGVMSTQWRESHGWMLQFDGNLKQTDATGKTFPVGAFGWDDTPSVVPSSMVPSYKGNASYLILSKYNNYDDADYDPGADGQNHVAVLDPTSNSITKDRQNGIPVMNEVLLVLSPTLNPSAAHPNAVTEWCINSAAIDYAKKSAIINCEDGHVYRWDFTKNILSEALDLQPATGEAYTSTVIGADGTIYAINNSILFAVGN